MIADDQTVKETLISGKRVTKCTCRLNLLPKEMKL